ncbi:MAG: hypothetical protein LBC83_01225 [Oscillospiraceae bacterium]|jgi:hypothetical protein|nr:hypothetical protein [Oscillospiraceae bacterium]
MHIKPLIRDTRKQIYRASSILFIVQLFGALGAGFFFVVQSILGVDGLLGAIESENEPILWFILFWGTDFFAVALCAVLCYLIAGLPGLAPGLALSVYFAHFAGDAPITAADGYFAFFATPRNGGGGVNIGYMGFFLMALLCALLIKLLYAGWSEVKARLGRRLDCLLARLRKKTKALPPTLTGEQVLENADLIVLVLLIPVVSAALTFIAVRYGIQKPFGALAQSIAAPLAELAERHIWLAGIVLGLLAGFDITGPMSMAGFAAASAVFLQTGSARLLTIYGACFIATGWAPLFMVLLAKKRKKLPADTDDFNLAIAGPTNAFFENIKLTVAFSMPFAMRSPLTVIPGLMAGGAFTGLATAAMGIVNGSYQPDAPTKYALGKPLRELLARGEIYLSFSLPLRSGDWLHCRLPLFLNILAGGAVGGLVMYCLRTVQVKRQKRRGTFVQARGDIVAELRGLAKKRLAGLK